MKKLNYENTLIRLRKSLKVSQQNVADAIAVSRPTYVSWEYGCGDIPFSKLVLLSNYYKISIHELIQMLFDENRLNHEYGDIHINVLKKDISIIKDLLEKYK